MTALLTDSAYIPKLKKIKECKTESWSYTNCVCSGVCRCLSVILCILYIADLWIGESYGKQRMCVRVPQVANKQIIVTVWQCSHICGDVYSSDQCLCHMRNQLPGPRLRICLVLTGRKIRNTICCWCLLYSGTCCNTLLKDTSWVWQGRVVIMISSF